MSSALAATAPASMGLVDHRIRQSGTSADRVLRATPSWAKARLAKSIDCQGRPVASAQHGSASPAAVMSAPRSAISAARMRVTMPSLGGRGGRRPTSVRPPRADGDAGQAMSQQVDPQDLAGQERQPEPEQGSEDHDATSASRRRRRSDEAADVVEDAPPFHDRGHEGREAVVGEDDVGGLLGDVRAAEPIATPTSAARSAGAVVDAVPGHGDDVAVGLPTLDERELAGRVDPGEHARLVVHAGPAACTVGRLRVLRGVLGGKGAGDACRGGDRRRRTRVVPGDQDGDHAGPAAGEHGVARFGPQRVGEGEEPRSRRARPLPPGGDGEDAPPSAAQSSACAAASGTEPGTAR